MKPVLDVSVEKALRDLDREPWAGNEIAEAGEPICRFGEGGRFRLSLAVTGEDRLKCWNLVYRQYVMQGYMKPGTLEYRYNIFDALPDTATFLVEADGVVAGTVTLFPDSPLGLPADEMYRREIDDLRKQGRLPVEVGRLVIGPEYMHERAVLTNLFDVLSIYSRRMLKGTDLVITVNPSHAKFYERMLAFERIGGEKDLTSVCGAAAVLLRLDQDREVQMRRYAHGEGERPVKCGGGRTLYGHLSSTEEEGKRVSVLRGMHQIMREDFLRRYFVWVRPLITSLPSSLKYFFEKCYPDYDLTGV